MNWDFTSSAILLLKNGFRGPFDNCIFAADNYREDKVTVVMHVQYYQHNYNIGHTARLLSMILWVIVLSSCAAWYLKPTGAAVSFICPGARSTKLIYLVKRNALDRDDESLYEEFGINWHIPPTNHKLLYDLELTCHSLFTPDSKTDR